MNVGRDDKNYRTINEVRRNRRSIVVMQIGNKTKLEIEAILNNKNH